jgi:YidC/Oxa1 family membrane protein insertase
MNKNTLIGTILMCLIFAAMMWFNQPSPEQIEAQRRYQDSIARAQREATVDAAAQQLLSAQAAEGAEADSLSATQIDSIKTLRLQQKYGNLAAAATGEDRVVTLANKVLSVGISAKGGVVTSARLADYKNYLDENIEVITPQDNKFYFTFLSAAGKYISTEELYFTPTEVTDTTVVMRITADPELGGKSYLELRYTLPADSYVLYMDLRYNGIGDIVSPTQQSMTLTWDQKLAQQEQGRTFEERYSSLFYKYNGESPDDLSNSKNDTERISGQLSWVGFKNQFFSAALVTNGVFNAGELTSTVYSEKQEPGYLKHYKAELEFDLTNSNTATTVPMAFYLGPNSYPLLAEVDDQLSERLGVKYGLMLQKLVPLGWGIFGWVNRFIVIPVFNLLSRFIGNYGVIILLLTLFIKLITLPFTYKSYLSSAKMRVVNKLPEVAAINAKYPNQEDAMAKQQALMALYSKVGVSPMGGCLPMLFQWPVLLALFYFFPTSIELRGQSFLWANDLSTYDSIYSWSANIPIISWIFGNHISLFCLLMTATNIIYTRITMQQNAGQQTMPGMKLMMYGMPLMFFAILNNYASGLSLYYFFSTLLGIIQTYIIRATLSEDKLMAQMQANMKNPKRAKKSSWLGRLQEAQRKQMEELNKQRERQQRRR